MQHKQTGFLVPEGQEVQLSVQLLLELGLTPLLPHSAIIMQDYSQTQGSTIDRISRWGCSGTNAH